MFSLCLCLCRTSRWLMTTLLPKPLSTYSAPMTPRSTPREWSTWNLRSVRGHQRFGRSHATLSHYWHDLRTIVSMKTHAENQLLTHNKTRMSCLCRQTPHIEPCSCFKVQINKVMFSFGRAVDGTASTGDVICHLFGTTVTNVAHCFASVQICVSVIPIWRKM